MSEKSVFDTLSAIDVTGKHKKKGANTYLPWSAAWDAVKRVYPDATWAPVKTPEGCIYHTDNKTCWVETTVTINGETQNEILPVMNHSNKSVAFDTVESTQYSNSLHRCLVKNLALFGLDLNLWYGEELSETAKKAKASKKAEDDKKKAEEEAARKKTAEELAKVHQAIIDMASAKKAAGADVEAIYTIVQKYSGGNKNPKAIKKLEDATACLKEVTDFK